MDNFLVELALLIIFAYLLGSFNFAIILCKLTGYPDPRTEGSNNPGATNVLRVANKYLAAIVLSCDGLKGFVPVFISSFLFYNNSYTAWVGLAAVLGHLYPLFFKFQGGKGVATYIGVLFAFYFPIGVVFCCLWFLIAVITKYSSLGAISSAITSLLLILWFGYYQSIFPFLIIVFFLLYKHKENIKRLSAGTEAKIKL